MPLKDTTIAFIRATPHAEMVLGLIRRDVGLVMQPEEQATLTAEEIIAKAKAFEPPLPPKPVVPEVMDYRIITAQTKATRTVRVYESATGNAVVAPSLVDDCIRASELPENDGEWEEDDSKTTDSSVEFDDDESPTGVREALARENIRFFNAYGAYALGTINSLIKNYTSQNALNRLAKDNMIAEVDVANRTAVGNAIFADSKQALIDMGVEEEEFVIEPVYPTPTSGFDALE